MNIKVARLTNPSELWMFQDEFIHDTLSNIATRLIVGAATGAEGFPSFAGDVAHPALEREVVALADGNLWLYADEVSRSIITPGAIAACHKCGDRGRIEGVFHVGWRNVVVEFAYCVGCMASHVAQAMRIADSLGGVVNVAARGEV